MENVAKENRIKMVAAFQNFPSDHLEISASLGFQEDVGLLIRALEVLKTMLPDKSVVTPEPTPPSTTDNMDG